MWKFFGLICSVCLSLTHPTFKCFFSVYPTQRLLSVFSEAVFPITEMLPILLVYGV